MEANILSDGEISNDSDENDRYSVISSGEDEYFKNLTNEIKSRQAELELENVLQGYVDDYAKENRFKKNKHPTKRSFRASSVLTNYSLPKRKRSYRQQKKKKHSRSSNKKSNDNKNIETMKIEDSGDDEDDCELIALRIKALKSKQELKECSPKQEPHEQKKEREREPEEEELLRIDALRSALLKKKDHFMEKKRKRKLEKEKPYSPTDDLDKILDVDTCQMDMEISTASNSPRCNDQIDTNPEEIHLMDMELVSSPMRTINENDNDEEEEEKALRSMLLSSISDKRKAEEKSVAMNLKLAVERLRQAHHKQQTSISSPQVPARLQASKKSGTKTIKMILEEKKFRKNEGDSEFQAQIEAENVLLNKITSEQNEVIEKLPTPLIEDETAAENNILLSTISDTKNIPLLSKEPESGRKKNRVLTSVIKYPVKPLIIKVNTESSDEEEEFNRDRKTVKKTHRKIINVSNTQQQQQIDVIEKQVENLLRKIRLQSEIQPKISTATATVQNAVSSLAVNHLPRSAQIEYAMLMEKMRVLEEAKIMRQKLKRQKSSSKIDNENIKKETSNPVISLKKKFATEKIEDTLSKIQFLGEEARLRFASNAENKYLAHTTSLKTTTEDLIKLVRANSFDVLRRQKVDAKIADLEKQLLKFRTMKRVIEQRINTGIPQIIRSQMALIKLRNHQHNFGNMCLRVGEIVRGPEYSLPDNHIQEIQKNLSHIVEECNEIQSACSEHFAIKHLSHNSQKIKEFISNTSNLNDNDAMIGDENIGANKAIDHDVSRRKRILGLDSSAAYSNMITKRIKYESPLEYARSEKSDEDVNRVVCPNTLRSSSCQDSACKMLHI